MDLLQHVFDTLLLDSELFLLLLDLLRLLVGNNTGVSALNPTHHGLDLVLIVDNHEVLIPSVAYIAVNVELVVIDEAFVEEPKVTRLVVIAGSLQLVVLLFCLHPCILLIDYV